ncbi:hypothetical protein P3H15_39900 [Rhodococcus sp. T2V]|uniref:hypothetical protein n=1 Tax=Rhodococcus sp. T2V TaxID=3034164 RepID=UPI0023E0F84E|nr:hypothetical protein [Rhodococcus sp. T2V]MDF3311163.1 hypothetical protein [Rhodococcus sp. T2V]
MFNLSIRGTRPQVVVGIAAFGDAVPGNSPSSDGNLPSKVGAFLPWTDEFFQPGRAALRSCEYWSTTVNEEDGLRGRDVDLVIKDDASSHSSMVERTAPISLPASVVAERNQLPLVGPVSGRSDAPPARRADSGPQLQTARIGDRMAESGKRTLIVEHTVRFGMRWTTDGIEGDTVSGTAEAAASCSESESLPYRTTRTEAASDLPQCGVMPDEPTR